MTTETTNTEYAGKGVAGTGLGLGIAGTALGLLNGGFGLLNNGGLNGRNSTTPAWVSKEEYEAGQQIAAKDAEIALLKSENSSETKMIDVYKTLATKIEALNEKLNTDNEKILTRTDGQFVKMNEKVDANRDRADNNLAVAIEKINGKIDFNKSYQDGVNAQQLAYNAGNTSTVACLQNQVTQLYSMTQLGVKNSALIPGIPPVVITHPSLSAS